MVLHLQLLSIVFFGPSLQAEEGELARNSSNRVQACREEGVITNDRQVLGGGERRRRIRWIGTQRFAKLVGTDITC